MKIGLLKTNKNKLKIIPLNGWGVIFFTIFVENIKTNKMKIKCICTHCGKKQTAEEIDYCLDNVPCKFCKKEGSLKESKINQK